MELPGRAKYNLKTMANSEIEIQVTVENKDNLIKFLEENALFKLVTRQVDEYLNAPDRDFLSVRPVTEWLRLRQTREAALMTYKKAHYTPEGECHFRDEFETTIGDIDQARKILLALGYTPLVTVDKIRKTWRYQEYEVALDEVQDLGLFVEVEYKGEDLKDPKLITDQMVEFLKQAGCGKIKRNYSGYPYILLLPDEVRYDLIDS